VKKVIVMLSAAACLSGQGIAHAQDMGWIPMDRDHYRSYMIDDAALRKRAAAVQTLPARWDWRDAGAVTPVRDQMSCGSCWAFSQTGALELHILIEFGVAYDLSEQMLVSCSGPPKNYGCCGGPMDAILFYERTAPREESCYPYVDGAFFARRDDCPPTSEGACYHACPPVCYNVRDYYTVDPDQPETVKRSIYQDGPSPVAFMVYEDFVTYWESPLGTAPWTDGVYHHASGDERGGHAVLAIGWDDDTSSYTIKNSWQSRHGLGPYGDGTCKMRTDQLEEVTNFRVVRGECDGYRIGLRNQSAAILHKGSLCSRADNTVATAWKVHTRFPERIQGGTWFSRYTQSTGSTSTEFEPIPNENYLFRLGLPRLIFKENCIRWDEGASWVDVECWMVDAGGVESAHETRRVQRPRRFGTPR